MSSDENTIKRLFDELDSNNNLALKKREHLSEEFKKIQGRAKQSGSVFTQYRKLFEDSSKFANYVKTNSEFGLNESDLTKIFNGFLINYSLDYIEITKKFLLENLDQNSTLDGKLISRIKTLGTLVHALSNQFNMPQLLPLFPYEFRNVLGHGSYWWNEHDHFCYIDEDGIDRELQFGEFISIMEKFDRTHLLIFREYIVRM